MARQDMQGGAMKRAVTGLAAVIVLAGCGVPAAARGARHHRASAESPVPAATTSGPSPCDVAVSRWQQVSLPGIPAPPSPVNSMAHAILALRAAVRSGSEAATREAGASVARDAAAVIARDPAPACDAALRAAVIREMATARLAGLDLRAGRLAAAGTLLRRATADQRRVQADEDATAGQDWGGW